MIDMHTHLLPGVDDGVQTEEESLKWLNLYREAGFTDLVCTPHIQHPSVRVDAAVLKDSYSWFSAEAEKRGIRTWLGGEYYVTGPEITSEYVFMDASYQLIECNTRNQPFFLLDLVFNLNSRGISVILAHIERYSWFEMGSSFSVRLREMGVLFQVNLDDMKTRIVKKLIKGNYADIIATDNHGFSRSRTDLSLFRKNRNARKLMEQTMKIFELPETAAP